jgi:NAD(P)-dependent dehydrogenase (short-subunit alcohol dehydrogenase family)
MLQGKVAFVTGGSRGIGFAIAQALSKSGASVAITGTNESRLRTAREELGQQAIGIRSDVRDFAAVQAAVNTTVEQFGGLDILVNNAGIGIFRAVADMTLEEWNDIFATNVSGVFHCTRAALPHLRARGSGWIINISSLASTNPFPEAAAYCASKAALNAFTEALMQEVRHDGIRVACVLPGSVRTGFSGRTPGSGDEWKLAPGDVAQLVIDLIGHPQRSLPSRVEIRPARPPKKG